MRVNWHAETWTGSGLATPGGGRVALLARERLGARSLSCWRNMIDASEFVVQLWALGTYYVDLADVIEYKNQFFEKRIVPALVDPARLILHIFGLVDFTVIFADG